MTDQDRLDALTDTLAQLPFETGLSVMANALTKNRSQVAAVKNLASLICTIAAYSDDATIPAVHALRECSDILANSLCEGQSLN